MPNDDCQSFFSVFTQISPCDDTLGWKIFVIKRPERTRGVWSAQREQMLEQKRQERVDASKPIVKTRGSLTFRRGLRELFREVELDSEEAAFVWRSSCTAA